MVYAETESDCHEPSQWQAGKSAHRRPAGSQSHDGQVNTNIQPRGKRQPPLRLNRSGSSRRSEMHRPSPLLLAMRGGVLDGRHTPAMAIRDGDGRKAGEGIQGRKKKAPALRSRGLLSLLGSALEEQLVVVQVRVRVAGAGSPVRPTRTRRFNDVDDRDLPRSRADRLLVAADLSRVREASRHCPALHAISFTTSRRASDPAFATELYRIVASLASATATGPNLRSRPDTRPPP